MAHKEFHLRANEVRAESRALMLKLRTERLAKSRHFKKPIPTEVSPNAQKAQRTSEHAPLPERAKVSIKASIKASVKTVVMPSKPQSNIIVSRKVNAAVTPIECSVSQSSKSEGNDHASDVFIESLVVPLSATIPVTAVSDVAPISNLPADSEMKAVRKTRTVKSKPRNVLPLVEPLVESLQEAVIAVKPGQNTPKPAFAAVLVEAGVLEMTSTNKRSMKNPVDVAVTSKPTTVKVSKAKSFKAKRELKPVDDIPVEGLGTVAELMEAVAASVRRPQTDVSRKPQKPAELSGNALMPVSTVPSLGPGMVWRLNQIGVKTLADLASIEPEELRSKLGPVAKLVRVENWIAFAKAA
jgi:hypothetical protein